MAQVGTGHTLIGERSACGVDVATGVQGAKGRTTEQQMEAQEVKGVKAVALE